MQLSADKLWEVALPLHGFWGWNSGHKTWKPAPLSTEPSYRLLKLTSAVSVEL